MFRHKNFENQTKIVGVTALTIKITIKHPHPIQELTRPEMMTALSILENFGCQEDHNSLNFGLIFKIFVPQHISFPRPFFFIY